MAAAVVGQVLVALCVVLTGLVGARWHVGFPMWNRVSHSAISEMSADRLIIDDLGSIRVVFPCEYAIDSSETC